MTTKRAPLSTMIGISLVALVAAACGGTAASVAPSVAPTTAPTPTPTPEPSVDVIGLVTRQLQDPAFAAHFDVSGSMQVATIDFDVTGTYDVDGEDYTSVVEASSPTVTSLTETRAIDGVTYARQDDGEWLTQDDGAGLDFGTFGLGLEDQGVETKDGRQLHRLTLKDPSALDPSVFGIDPSQARDAVFGLELFTTPEGDLAIMAITLEATMLSGGAELPLELAMDFILDPDAPADVAAAPDDPWTVYHSEEYGYTIAIPDGWDAEGVDSDGAETFSSDTASLTVLAYDIEAGTTLAEYGETVLAELADLDFGEPVATVDVTFGAAKEPGVAYLFTGVQIEFEDDNLVYAVTIHDGVAYDFAWAFDAGDFGEQGTLVDRFLTTFTWD